METNMPAKINLRDIISVEDEQNLISNFQLGHTIKDLSFAAKLPRHHVYLILERNQIEITNNKNSQIKGVEKTNKLFIFPIIFVSVKRKKTLLKKREK